MEEAAPPKLGDVVRNPFNDNKALTAGSGCCGCGGRRGRGRILAGGGGG